jgi:hypothetical protein
MTLNPGDKPLFMKGQASEEYPGYSEPTFDEELEQPKPEPEAKELLQAAIELPSLPALTEGSAPAGKGPSKGYEVRRQMIGQLHARGYTNAQIGRHLGYSPAGISIALKDPYVQQVATEERKSLVDASATDIIKRTSIHAAQRLERRVLDPESKNGDQISQFILEKATGKAVQAIQHESGTLMQYIELLKSMQSRGESIEVPGRQVAEVSHSEETEVEAEPSWNNWLDDNL